MFLTDDPAYDYERYTSEQQKAEEAAPTCDVCAFTVLEDHYYLINGEITCQSCADLLYRREIEA